MGLLDNVERGLEKLVSGAFAKSFRGGVQPIEIVAALKRELDSRAVVRDYANRQRYSFAAPVTVTLAAAADIPNGVVRVTSQALDAVAEWQPALDINGTTVYLTQSESIIGRGATATVVINDGGASRNHARIIWNGKAAGLEDLQSTNGTLLNGQRVSASPLEQGDVIEIGGTRMIFRILPGSAA